MNHHAGPKYEVTVEPRIPEFGAERLFVAHEKQFAKDAIIKLEGRPKVLDWVAPIAGELTAKQWQKYVAELDAYLAKIAEHEAEIEDGLVPVKFFVINTGTEADKAICIRISVKNGTLDQVKQPPERPARIDGGAKHVPEWKPAPGVPKLGGFSRTDIKLADDSVAAKFSELQAQDSADLVNQLLYVMGDETTRLHYEIVSKGLPKGVRGEIKL